MKNLKLLLIIFLGLEISLYLTFMLFSTSIEYILNFLTVLLAFLFTLLIPSKWLDSWLLRTALLFTVLADVLLVLFKDYFPLALCFFILTQVAYMTRLLYLSTKKERKIQIIIQGSLIGIVLVSTFLMFKENIVSEMVLTSIYFPSLVSNIIFAYQKRKQMPLFWIGVLLFCLCDIFVGFGWLVDNNVVATNSLIYSINAIPFNFVWFFYTPSQVLLALTIIKKRNTSTNRQLPR